MFSRRSFLFASLGLLFAPHSAFAKKHVDHVVALGPHSLSKEEWPPALSPDFLSAMDKGYTLLSDQSGRLTIVNFKREGGPLVVGEIGGIGKKVIDLSVTPQRAYALSYQETQGGDGQYSLVTISILPPNDPTIFSRRPLGYFSEPTTVAAGQDLVAVGGVGLNGENQVLLFAVNPKHHEEGATPPLATLSLDSPVTRLDYQDKQLFVLQAAPGTSKLDVFNLSNPHDPQKVGTVKFEGNYPVLARAHETMAVAGQGTDRKWRVKLLGMKPSPHVVADVNVPMSEILDMVAQRGQLLVLGNQINRQVVIPISTVEKKTGLASAGQPVLLPPSNRGVTSKARISAFGKDAFVASDWGGVQVLNISKNGWQYLYSHTIPRLPAAAIAVNGNHVALGGADLKVYNIVQPEHPVLVGSAECGSAVKAVSILNNSVLALCRDTLSLRTLDRPSETVSTVKVSGRSLAVDEVNRRAYVLAAGDKTTTVTSVRVSTALVAEAPAPVDGVFQNVAADNGQLIMSGLNNLALYSVADNKPQLLGTRIFPNLAIRDIWLTGAAAIITAVDSELHGFLLVIDTSKQDLPTIGSVDLPQDAVALAVSKNSAVVVGRSPSGKDFASIVDLSNKAAPKIVTSLPVLEAASAVAIKDRMALIAGRGFEILSLA